MHSATSSQSPVVIVGAGIAGLAVGCYLRASGYDTTILEMGDCCGGVCVSWKRKGYVFDGATNWLPGGYPSCNLHGMLAELIDFSRMPLYFSDVFIRVEKRGQVFTVYKDADRLRAEMLRIAPEDAGPIREFIAAVKHASTLQVPWEHAIETLPLHRKIAFAMRYAPVILHRTRWRGITIEQYAQRFESPALREFFPCIFPRHGFFSVFGIIMALGWMHAKGEGYPYGGSEHFTAALEERYRSLGGGIVFGKKVARIEESSGRATGVLCEDGSHHAAGVVISAADGYDTVYRMLGGRHLTGATRRRFQRWRVFPSVVQVSLGLARTFEADEPKACCDLTAPLTMGAGTIDDMLVRICSFDPGMAPAGKTSIVVHLRIEDYRYWVDLRARDMAAYRVEKQRVADAVIAALDKQYTRIRETLEAVDVATPATFIRYTNNWKGAYQSWAPTPQSVGALLPKTVPGLRNFYMTGHWLWPGGGLPAAIRLSRDVAQMVCHKDGRVFRAGGGAPRPPVICTPEELVGGQGRHT